MDSVFFAAPRVNFSKGSHNEDIVDQMLLSRKRSSQGHSERDSMGNNFAKITFNMNGLETPFDSYLPGFFYGGEESTHDSALTGSRSGASSGFLLSANNSDLEEMMNNDEKLDKLMQDLESIDLPLSQKRLRSKKSTKVEIDDMRMEDASADKISEEEKRRRKNKEQVQILHNEYLRTANWTRQFMKELAKRTGLTSSQVYKWNWDQKKKEADERK